MTTTKKAWPTHPNGDRKQRHELSPEEAAQHPTLRERVAKVEEQVQRACLQHGLLQVWFAWLKFSGDDKDETALPAVGIDNPYTTDTAPLQQLHKLLPKDYLDKEQIVFYLNEDTLETKHIFLSRDKNPFEFNEFYTDEDKKLGWKPQSAANAFFYSASRIEEEHANNVAFSKRYWSEYLVEVASNRVVENGIHYVAHPVETGTGFGGERFLINWLNADLAPSICNLSYQGKVPAWIRAEIPDNAQITRV